LCAKLRISCGYQIFRPPRDSPVPRRRPRINNLEWALLADGVAPADVYTTLSTDQGVARALAKLDTIKDQVVWWTKGAQPPQLLADGEAVMASACNGRLFSAIAEKNQPIAMMCDRQVFDLDGWVVPVGVKLIPAPRSGSVARVTGACVCDGSGVNWHRVG